MTFSAVMSWFSHNRRPASVL